MSLYGANPEQLASLGQSMKSQIASIYAKLAIPGRVALAIHVVRSRAA